MKLQFDGKGSLQLAVNAKAFRVTIVHPCVGRSLGMKKYIRTWQMEPLPSAMIAALLPADVERRFYDDRLEAIPYDEPTDLVAISLETYTAKRAYQIASEYRRRGVPVVMGGFHATLCPHEVMKYCESIVIGEAEAVLSELIDDYRHGSPKRIYENRGEDNKLIRPPMTVSPDRSIFMGKKYLPIRLIEFARGCRFKCDFCAIQSYFNSSHNHRPIETVVDEIERVRKPRQLIFFIDDNLTSNLPAAKEFMRAIEPLGIRWVSQTAINVAFDEEALLLMKRSGCQGVLVGFESLEPETLKQMNKGFNLMRGGPVEALANFRKFGLRIYGTFIFGYDHDTSQTFDRTVSFAIDHGMFIAAFNHITPFPGTPLFERMKCEGRLLYDAWWLDKRYRYNMIPYIPKNMSPEELADRCVKARRDFYRWHSIFCRSLDRIHWRSPWMFFNFFLINAMHQWDIEGRNGLPLGDANWTGELISVDGSKLAQ